MNDNMSLNLEDYQIGMKIVRSSISYMSEISEKLNDVETLSNELGVSTSNIKNNSIFICSDLRELYDRLNKIKKIMLDISPNYIDVSKSDYLKGQNSDSGADISLDAGSLLDKETALDRLKTMNGDANCDKSSNTRSILDMLKTEDGVNLVLDSLKNSGDDGSIKSLNANSILNREM